MYISDLAYRERLTQMQGRFLRKVASCRGAVRTLMRDQWSTTLDRHNQCVFPLLHMLRVFGY